MTLDRLMGVRASWATSSAASLVAVMAAAAVALAGCGSQGGAGDSTLPPLQLTDGGGSERSLAPATTGGGEPSYVLHTTLPAGTPAPAPVWRLPRATAKDAARVAEALGVGGPLVAVKGGWVGRRATQRLAVRLDGTWMWGLDCSPDVPIEQESLDVACAAAAGGTSTSGGGPSLPAGPTAEQARALAAPILRRLGWGSAALDVVAGAPTTSVTARRSLPDTTVADWTTGLSFDSSSRLTDANGWTGEPTRGRSYPLIDAARAFAMLTAQRLAMPELCRVRKDGKPGCEPIPPVVVTGVRLGLSVRHDLDRPLLVPSWLFEVRGGGPALAVVAVDPRWLKPPESTVPVQRSPQTVPVNPAGPATKPS